MKKTLLCVVCVLCVFVASALPALAREDVPVAFFSPDDMMAYIRVPGSESDDYPYRFYFPPALTKPTEYAKLYAYLFARDNDGIPTSTLRWNTSCSAVNESAELYRCNYQLDPTSVTDTAPWFEGFVTFTVSGFSVNNVNSNLFPSLLAYDAPAAREVYRGNEPYAVTYSSTYFSAVHGDDPSPEPSVKTSVLSLESNDPDLRFMEFSLVEPSLPDDAYVTQCTVTFPACLLLYGNTHLFYTTTWSASPTWRNYIRGGYGLYDFIDGWIRPYEVVDFEDIDLTSWLGNALGGVFDVPLFGGITLGTVLGTCIGIGLAIFILKRFSGG